MKKGENRRVDLYFSLPKEMGINKDTLSETEYFNAGIDGRRTYHTKGLHLALLLQHFSNNMRDSVADYKSNLNQFAYQYITALDTGLNEVLAMDDNDDLAEFYSAAVKLTEDCLDILKKHRSQKPKGVKLLSVYESIDNYLSWYTEQSILRILVKQSRTSEFSETRSSLLTICEKESQYRSKKNYNLAATIRDSNRIANKMRLLRRLIEYGVIFKSKTITLGNNTRKIVSGVATALLMSVVLVLILMTQGAFSHLSSLMILILSAIYGAREIFKEEFINILWRWVSHGKPKWSRSLYDATSRKEIAKQKVWLDYLKIKKLPKKSKALLAERRSQNQQSAEILHYRIETFVNKKGFQSGYDTIEESIVFNLRPLTRFIEGGIDKVYERVKNLNNKDKIQTISIERRYQINIIIAFDQCGVKEHFERYRITLNRSGIVEIVKAGEVKIKDTSNKSFKSRLHSLLRLKRCV